MLKLLTPTPKSPKGDLSEQKDRSSITPKSPKGDLSEQKDHSSIIKMNFKYTNHDKITAPKVPFRGFRGAFQELKNQIIKI